MAREFGYQVSFHAGRLRRKFIGMLAETPKLCSCVGCGNPRRYFGEAPARELRALEPADWP